MNVIIKGKGADTFRIERTDERQGKTLKFRNIIFTCEAIEDVKGNVFVKHRKGRWIDEGDCYRCSECGAEAGWWLDADQRTICKCCGTYMTEGEV